MKFLVLFLATTAVASASLFRGQKVNFKEDGSIIIQGVNGEQVVLKKPFDLFGIKNAGIGATGPNSQAKIINQVGIKKDVDYYDFLEDRNKHVPQVLHTEKDSSEFNELKDQNVENYFYNLLFKMFDKEIIKNILKEKRMNDQYTNRQESIATTWDFILAIQGIFDKEYLITLINDPMMRSWLVHLGLFDREIFGQIQHIYKTQGVYDQSLLQKLVSAKVLRYFLTEHGVSAYDILGPTPYKPYYGINNMPNRDKVLDTEKYSSGLDELKDQDDDNYFYNLFFNMFDREVIKNILNEQKMSDQYYNRQESIDDTWDFVLAKQGIFDREYLIQIINDQMLRSWLVHLGFFDREVFNQILHTYKTKGVYVDYLLQKLVNTKVLKYFFTDHGVSAYDILGQTSYKQYNGNNKPNTGIFGLTRSIYGHNMLQTILKEPSLRNVLIQYGLLNQDVLDKILYLYNTQGVFNQVLLRQLVNKQALHDVLIQYGVVDQAELKHYVINENLGLYFLFENNFFQETPKMTSNQLFGVDGLNPVYSRMPPYYMLP